MADLSFVDLVEHNGELLQLTGKLSVADLLKSEHDVPSPATKQRGLHRIRAFMRSEAGRDDLVKGESLAHLGMLQSSLLRVVNSLLESRGDTDWSRSYRTVFALNLDRHNLNELRVSDFGEAVDYWVRQGGINEALIEVREIDVNGLQAASNQLTSYIGSLQESVEAAREFQRKRRPTLGDLLSASSQGESVATQPRVINEAQTPAQTAAARRLELGGAWLTAAQVSSLLGSQAENRSQAATVRRNAGEILGAWAPQEKGFRYPPWQFAEDGQPRPEMKRILELLRKEGGMGSVERRTSGWKEAEWFMAPHVLLDDSRPADLMQTEPGRVLEAAVEQFERNSDAGGF